MNRTRGAGLVSLLILLVGMLAVPAAAQEGKGHTCQPSHGSAKGKGANTDSADNKYHNTCDGSASRNGKEREEGSKRPCAGCVGNADDKNPPGQAPDASDHNNGYECDGNNGVAKTNPAHTGCKEPPPVCDADPHTPGIQECITTEPPCDADPTTPGIQPCDDDRPPPCDADADMPGIQPCDDDRPPPCDEDEDMPGIQPCDEGPDLIEDDSVPEDDVLGERIYPEADRPLTQPARAGAPLPVTGQDQGAWTSWALGLIGLGTSLLTRRRRGSAGA